jgi:dipeptidyl aminopeptidase/acylaminoacyl peptidase
MARKQHVLRASILDERWFAKSARSRGRGDTISIDLETGEEIDLTRYENTLGTLLGGSYRHLRASKLFDTHSTVMGKPLVDLHPVVIKSRDGLDLVSYVSLPPHVSVADDFNVSETVPMVLWVHGGPWARDGYGYSGIAQWLTNRGYATLVGVTFTPAKFACGVDIVGSSNLVTLLDSIPEYWQSFFDVLVNNVGDPRTEEGQRFLRSRSPLFLTDRITKPLLIGQGANDPRVTQIKADQYENFGDSFDGSSATAPHGAEFVPGLAEALAGAEIVNKN